MGTTFTSVYDAFLNRVTDDMFMEYNEIDTYRILQDLLIAAIPNFEFPRKDLSDYTMTEPSESGYYCGVESNFNNVPIIIYEGGYFNVDLTMEEIMVLVYYMIVGWIDYQLASVENTRMKYSGWRSLAQSKLRN